MAYLGRQPNTGVRSRYIFTATASQTTFSGSDDDGKTLKYEDAAYLDVFLNGVLLKPVTDYTATSKTSVVLTSGAAVSDIVEIVAYDIANIANTVSATNGGTFEADVTVQGTVTADGLTVDTNTLYVDAANNRVGIGTTSPSRGPLQLNTSSGSTEFHMTNADTGSGSGDGFTLFMGASAASDGAGVWYREAGPLRFATSGTERARIDSSGYVLVGVQSTTNRDTTAGIYLGSSVIQSNRSGAATGDFGRLSSDGDVVVFRKDGTVVGSIGVAGDLFINSQGSTGYLRNAGTTEYIWSASAFRPNGDNTSSIGAAGDRFTQLYAASGTINTSDATEKQDVVELDEAEKRVATTAKGLIRKFRWIDAVEAKGDDARIHVGVIAQDLKSAFEAEGLDAHRYGMFCSDTWWEADEVVPAVEEVLDEEGNVITEAQPERTEKRTYYTAEEAPAGAVERTRLGVRYPELLAFIIGAM